MPSTPNNLMPKRFQRHAYSRVSFTNIRSTATAETPNSIEDVEAQTVKKAQPPLKPGVSYINPGQDEQMEVWGYRRSWVRTVFCYAGVLLTAGLLRLVLHWIPQLLLACTHEPCPLAQATRLLFVELFQGKYRRFHVKDFEVVTNSSVEEESKSSRSPRQKGECLDDVQVLTTLGQEDTLKLSLHFRGGTFEEVDSVRMVRVKKRRYIWQPSTSTLEPLQGYDREVPAAVLHQQQGLSQQQQTMRRRIYGSNEILVPVHSVIALLLLEILNPFYVFQFFSFCLWFIDDYILYASAILIMTAGGVSFTVYQTRRNQINLQSTVHSRDVATVRRLGGVTETISTDELVPGDVLVLPPHGCVLHCDAVLLSGNCIVNESMLTGESEPVTKTPLPNSPGLVYDSKEHARHTLFCGTRLLQTRFYAGEPVLGVVVRTGFQTSKGNLVCSMLYPPPVDFKFDRDSYRFIEVLAGIAGIGFIYTMVAKHLRGVGTLEILVDALDLITIVVPPALPAAMAVGRMYAQSRLTQANVYCISPRTINVAGSINCICFDKTGTLTEEGLDLWGVIPVTRGSFKPSVHEFPPKSELNLSSDSPPKIDELTFAMACAHSLTLIDNRLAGDPLDLKMFESTGWILEEPAVDDSSKYDQMYPTVVQPPRPDILLSAQSADTVFPQVGIVRQFPFSASLQRMSVMVKALWEPEFRIFCKGAPEAVAQLCQPDSVPKDFARQLQQYTRQGLRVLALAGRRLRTQYHRVHRLAREDAERDLTLLGLLVMENRLKDDSGEVIAGLREACIRCIMVTGDNMLTALSVARECGVVASNERVAAVHVVPPLPGSSEAKVYYTDSDVHDASDKGTSNGDLSHATVMGTSPLSPRQERFVLTVSGTAWEAIRTHCPALVPTIATRGAVFARMSPEHKQQLVQELQALGYYVGMVGDGANDCGALKAAHAGISLSDAESSVASPFTSREPSVSCVQRLMRESRAALVTSFGLFKYMAAYSLTQFTSVLILYERDANLSDIQFVVTDLFLITTVAFFFGRTQSHTGPLAKKPPSASLVSPAPITSLVVQLILVATAQAFAFYHIQQYSWYEKYDPETAEDMAGYENYAIFSVSSFQYLVLAIVFSQGAPYRQPLYSNIGLMITLGLGITCCLFFALSPFQWVATFLEFRLPPTWVARVAMVAIAFIFTLASFGCEVLITKGWSRYKEDTQEYELVDKKLTSDRAWPRICEDIPQASPPPTPDTPSTRMQVLIHEGRVTSPGQPSGEVTLNPAMLIPRVKLRKSTPLKQTPKKDPPVPPAC